MRLLLLALLTALWCACPEPTPPCQQGPVFGGPPNLAPLGFVGREVRFDVTAPLIACASDTVRVDVEAFDEANQPVPVSAGTPQVSGGVVTATLSLTPTTPGVHAVRVFFEPSLGNVQLSVVVAVEPDVAPIDETFPVAMNRCFGGLARAASGAVLCSDGVDTVVYRGGVEESRFTGGGLVVVDDVAWTQTDQGVLERRVERDGGFVLEGQATGYPLGTGGEFVGEHTRTVALRAQFVDRVRAATWDADAGTLTAVDWNPDQPVNFYVAQGDTLWGVAADGEVLDLSRPSSDALPLGGPVGGVTGDGVWFSDFQSLRMLRRPFDRAAPRMLSLPPSSELELAPLALGSPGFAAPRLRSTLGDDPTQLLLLVLRGGNPGVEAWRLPSAPRVVGRHWIILPGAAPEQLRFLRRPDATP